MKVRRGKFSGAVGNEGYVKTKQGQVVRSRPSRPPRATNDRLRARRNLGRVASVWRTLTDPQFAAWAVAAKKEKMKPYRLFCKINGTLAAYGQPLVMDPPKREKLQPNPVGALDIRNRGGVSALRLRVPKAPAKFTFVFGIRWCSRGISVPRSNGELLGRLPEAQERFVCHQLWRRPGRYHFGQICLLRKRCLLGGKRQDPLPGVGRH